VLLRLCFINTLDKLSMATLIIMESLSWVLFAVLMYMTSWFIVGLLTKRNDVADVAWGLGFIMISLVVLFGYGINGFDRGALVTFLILIWGGRLSYHIFRRNIRKSEDARYVAWRVEWGRWFIIRSYLQIYLLQGLLMILIATPVIFINTFRGGSFTFLDLLGVLVWLTGFYFESRGDAQLKEFIKNPDNKGKILNTGLWKYTRHPNYFGEVTQWWGIWIIGFSIVYAFNSTLLLALISIIGPLTITFLILKVSGIPMLEKSMAKNPLFDEYRRTTSVFFPLPPKK